MVTFIVVCVRIAVATICQTSNTKITSAKTCADVYVILALSH